MKAAALVVHPHFKKGVTLLRLADFCGNYMESVPKVAPILTENAKASLSLGKRVFDFKHLFLIAVTVQRKAKLSQPMGLRTSAPCRWERSALKPASVPAVVYLGRKKETLHRLLKSVLGFLGDYFSDTHVQQLEENSPSGDSQKSFGSLNLNPPEK